MRFGNVPSFDGKLTGIKWMAKDGIGYERSYSVTYDQLNRYTGETYAERTGASTSTFSNNFHGFDENNITYDAGGNLLTLTPDVRSLRGRCPKILPARLSVSCAPASLWACRMNEKLIERQNLSAMLSDWFCFSWKLIFPEPA